MAATVSFPEDKRPEPAGRWQVCLLLAALAVLAYAGSFTGPFVFDDLGSIVENPTVRRPESLRAVVNPPQAEGATVGGRPLLNASFALNHALSREAVWSYHAGNVLLHVASTLLLFGLARRAFARLHADARAMALGTATAALWALHPLQTESVAYIAQRAESLVSFFYLLTLYAFARGGGWRALSVFACWCGMASKEVMVTAPVVVLLYDRTFVAGSFASAWRQRRGYYFGLAATWLLLGWLVWSSGGARGDTAGLGTSLSPLAYGLTQCAALVHYLRLVFWPAPLVFDYGNAIVTSGAQVWPQLLLIVALLGTTLVALRRRPVLGFAGAAFFLVLAPSSSVVPIASQTMAEHRMYLALAVPIALAVEAAARLFGTRARLAWVALVLVLLALTAARVRVYQSDLALWNATAATATENARAHNNLAQALLARGQIPPAIERLEAALRLRPDYADAHTNLGHALLEAKRPAEAVPHLEAALRVRPDSPAAWNNLGRALALLGREAEALTAYDRAIARAAEFAPPRYNRGNLQLRRGHLHEAIADYEAAVRIDPNYVDARFNLAQALVRANRIEDAALHYETILRLAPNDAAAHVELANLLAHLGRTREAIAHCDAALRLAPDFVPAQRLREQLRGAPLR